MSRFKLSFFTLGLISLILLAFQNCADSITWTEEGETEQTSLKIELQEHINRDHWTEPLQKVRVESTAEDLIADRRLLMAILENIFGPSFKTVDNNRIQTNGSELGNPCSVYEDFIVINPADSKRVRADASRTCLYQDSAEYLNAPIIPKASVIRQRNIANVCHSLSTNTTTRNFAVAQIGAGNPQPTSANVRKAFHLFYRNKPSPPETLIQSLQVMMPGKGSVKADWAAVLYSVCISSGWQIL